MLSPSSFKKFPKQSKGSPKESVMVLLLDIN